MIRTSSRWARLGGALIVCCGVLATAGPALATSSTTTYAATQSIAVPPASHFAGSGGGDGWAVALSSTQVFNVFHHAASLQVVCHNQSDASVCWGPDTITDGSGNNFATSSSPGMYLDQNTGKLYVYATRTSDASAGVVCIDTTLPAASPDPDRFCGYTTLAPAGQAALAGISQVSDPMLVGNRWYAFNANNGLPESAAGSAANAMLCFDVSTDTACAGQPFHIDLGLGTVADGVNPAPSPAALGSKLIVPVSMSGGGELACFDASTASGGNCAGSWPLSTSGTAYSPAGSGAPFQQLDSSGNLLGFCLPDGTDECFGLDGSSHATPAGMQAAIATGSVGYNGPGVQVGPRVYVPAWPNIVYCYDAATRASCANFPKQFADLSLLYTVNPDPQRPTCIWVNSDGGSSQIQNFDAFTGGACGEGAIRALASQFVVNQPQCMPTSYVSLQILQPARNTYASGSISFEDGDGNPIPGATDRQLDRTGSISLTGLNLNTATGLPQFLIALNGTSGSPSQVEVKLTWNATYDPSCIRSGITASPPPITASPVNVNTTEGKAFSGPVATFSDPDSSATPSTHAVTINWGDGSTSSGTATGTPSKFTVGGTHTYKEEGSHSVKVTIGTGPRSTGATVTGTAKVGDAKLHAKGSNPKLSGKAVSGTLATFTDDNPFGTQADFTATINWGDGHSSKATVTDPDTTFHVSGSHTYSKNGTFTIKVSIKDKGGSTASASVPVTFASHHATHHKVVHGTARLRGIPAACVLRPFTPTVTGARIASVSWTLDGHGVKGHTVQSGKKYSSRVSASPGSHHLTVKVRFVKTSQTGAKTFHRTVSGCPVIAPKFTG
jgi:hypothetical protein